MSEYYRIRIKRGEFEVEVESHDKDYVEGKVEEYLNQIATLTPPTQTVQETTVEPSTTPSVPITDTLMNLVKKGIVALEKEWILIYAYWTCKKEAKEKFTWADIKAKYKETGRLTKSRQSAISRTLASCIKEGWITQLKKGSYIITGKGEKEAIKIMQRTSPPKKGETK